MLDYRLIIQWYADLLENAVGFDGLDPDGYLESERYKTLKFSAPYTECGEFAKKYM